MAKLFQIQMTYFCKYEDYHVKKYQIKGNFLKMSSKSFSEVPIFNSHLSSKFLGIAEPIIFSDCQGRKIESIEINFPLLFSDNACKI